MDMIRCVRRIFSLRYNKAALNNWDVFVRVQTKPKKKIIGSRMYTAYRNKVLGYHKILRFEEIKSTFIAEGGWEITPGKYIILEGKSWKKLTDKFPEKVWYNATHGGFVYVDIALSERLHSVDMNSPHIDDLKLSFNKQAVS